MKIVEQSWKYNYLSSLVTYTDMVSKVEMAAKNCYMSECCKTFSKSKQFIKNLIKRGHLSPLEHASISVGIVTDRAVLAELTRHRLASFCLSGDTIVSAFNSKKRFPYKKWTIKELYESKFDSKRKGRIKLINLRSVNDNNIIVSNKIKDILFNGIQDVFLLKTKSGKQIKATEAHRFYTPFGYKMLKDLCVGDKVYANGIPLLENKEYLEKRYLVDNITKKELSLEIGCSESTLLKAFRKFGIVKQKSKYPNRVAGYGKRGMFSEKERKNISKRMKGENSPSWKGDKIKENSGRERCERLFKLKEPCWGCGSLLTERHHLDENPLNNDRSNILFLCSSCHKSFHGKNTLAVFSDEIVSIEYLQKEEVYDISMMNEPHNFIANGLAVHNSVESQRFVKYKEIEFVRPVWFTDNDFIHNNRMYSIWVESCDECEGHYHLLLNLGQTPQQARMVLNNSTKVSLTMTANIREWRHILELRTRMDNNPQMRDLMVSILTKFAEDYPVFFEDILEK